MLDDTLRSDLGRAIGCDRRLAAALADRVAQAPGRGWPLRVMPADHARRSVVRRAYLYLALFAGVIGGMIFAVALVFELLNMALTGERGSGFVTTILNDLQLLVLFAILLVYHLVVMRRDGRFRCGCPGCQAEGLQVAGGGFRQGLCAVGPGGHAARARPMCRLTVSARQPRGKFDAMIVAGSQLLDAPAVGAQLPRRSALSSRDAAEGLHWAGGIDANPIQKAALAARQLAEGQAAPRTPRRSGWMVVVYIAAALFGADRVWNSYPGCVHIPSVADAGSGRPMAQR